MDKKAQIIEIATRLFAERGFENTPLSLICEEAKVSKGLIFHHFKSKNELLRAIFSKTTELIREINQSSKPDAQPRERLLELIDSFFTGLEADKMFVQLNLNIILQPSTRAVLKDLIHERSAFILHSAQQIFEAIDPTEALVKSYLFIAELDGIALSYLCIYEDFPLTEIKQKIIDRYVKL